MTTEDDFQAALDADPTDWQTRLVFADWLEERGDPRSAGYRALGRLRVSAIRIQMQPDEDETEEEWVFIFGNDANDSSHARERWGRSMLPEFWFKKLKQQNDRHRNMWWRYFDTRREADDAAARAFARLAKARRDQLVNPVSGGEPLPGSPRAPVPVPDEPPAETSRKRKRRGTPG